MSTENITLCCLSHIRPTARRQSINQQEEIRVINGASPAWKGPCQIGTTSHMFDNTQEGWAHWTLPLCSVRALQKKKEKENPRKVMKNWEAALFQGSLAWCLLTDLVSNETGIVIFWHLRSSQSAGDNGTRLFYCIISGWNAKISVFQMRMWETSRIAADWTQMASFSTPWALLVSTLREMLSPHAEVSVNSVSEYMLHFGNIELRISSQKKKPKKPASSDSIYVLKQCFLNWVGSKLYKAPVGNKKYCT